MIYPRESVTKNILSTRSFLWPNSGRRPVFPQEQTHSSGSAYHHIIRENLHLGLVTKDDKAFDESLSGFTLYRPSKGGPRRSSDSSEVMEKPLFLSECFHSAPHCRDKDVFPRRGRGKRKRRGFWYRETAREAWDQKKEGQVKPASRGQWNWLVTNYPCLLAERE